MRTDSLVELPANLRVVDLLGRVVEEERVDFAVDLDSLRKFLAPRFPAALGYRFEVVSLPRIAA